MSKLIELKKYEGEIFTVYVDESGTCWSAEHVEKKLALGKKFILVSYYGETNEQ